MSDNHTAVTEENGKQQESQSSKAKRHPHPRHRNRPKNKSEGASGSSSAPAIKEKATETEVKEDDADRSQQDLCFICAEPVLIYSLLPCNHRTCHLCALRLRSLYGTRHCAYCKIEQEEMIMTNDQEKPFENYTAKDTPFTDAKLNVRFETEQMYKDTLLLLQYNCPDPDCNVACDGGWPELKKHVKKVHDRLLCDFCLRFKKIFSHEHTLYTQSKLDKHYKQGDKEDSGFRGHPECQFCRSRFYGNDELYEHCRDKHEQCHICRRNGRTNEYYVDYSSLEDHFRKDHFLCSVPECLEKKFIVFENKIDLKAHQVEMHLNSIPGLSRSQKLEMKRIDINIEYNDSNRRQQRGRPSQRQGTDERQGSSASGSNPGSALSQDDFPSIGGTSSSDDTKGSQSRRSQIRKPQGFGSLSAASHPTPAEAAGTTAAGAPGELQETSKNLAPEEEKRILDSISSIVPGRGKLDTFKSSVLAYRAGHATSEKCVQSIITLCQESMEHASQLISAAQDLMATEAKKHALQRAWDHQRQSIIQFPSLQSSKPAAAGHATSSRVLVIKNGNTRLGGTQTTKSKQGVWNRVATAASASSSATTFLTSRAPAPFSKPRWTSAAGSTHSSSSNVNSEEFPSLPSAPTKHPLVMDLRQTRSNRHLNAWDGSGSENETPLDQSTQSTAPTMRKKGKNKRQIIFRVGM